MGSAGADISVEVSQFEGDRLSILVDAPSEWPGLHTARVVSGPEIDGMVYISAPASASALVDADIVSAATDLVALA